MYLGACPSPLTIYGNIFSVRPAHKFQYSFKDKKSSTEQYWNLEYRASADKISKEEFQKDVEELCILYNTQSHAKALMLSGGLDSGQLAYSFGKVDDTMKGFTIYQPGSKYNELEQTKVNTDNAGLELKAIEVPSSFSSEELLEYQTAEEEPNVVPEPLLILSAVAKENDIRVLYSGLGPDEIFGGYEYFQKINKWSKYSSLSKLVPAGFFTGSKSQKLSEIKEFGISTLLS